MTVISNTYNCWTILKTISYNSNFRGHYYDIYIFIEINEHCI